jgi:hypothetical protein
MPLEELRPSGYTAGEAGAIVANVAPSLFTNDFNHVAGMEVDSPSGPGLYP